MHLIKWCSANSYNFGSLYKWERANVASNKYLYLPLSCTYIVVKQNWKAFFLSTTEAFNTIYNVETDTEEQNFKILNGNDLIKISDRKIMAQMHVWQGL